MNMRRRSSNPLSSPVLVGALTVLVTIIATVLAYQSNNGLPFVPRYHLHVDVPNAEEVTRGGEVHMGGALVGFVDQVTPARTANGTPIAVLDLALNKDVDPLPVNSHFEIRLKAAIGEKYVAIERGTSRRGWRSGATVPANRTGADVDLDQLFSMYTPRTSTGINRTTTGFSDALAGRGDGINDAIHAFVPLVTDLTPVMRNLSAPSTHLKGFLDALERFTGALAPVANAQAALYANLDGTFHAIAGVALPYLQNWIADTPPDFRTVIADSPREQTFVRDTTALFADLRPGFATLPESAPVLADAFAVGVRTLPGTGALDRRTVSLSRRLARYGADPTVTAGLNRLTLTGHSLTPLLTFLTPTQSTCNYVTLFLRNIASALSDDVGGGTVLRFTQIAIDDVPGAESVPSSHVYRSTQRTSDGEVGPLHDDPYPNTDAPGETAECSAGNEPYSAAHAVIGNPAGNVGLKTQVTKRSGG